MGGRAPRVRGADAGFAPAAPAATWTIDLKRAAWTGPVPDGRVDFVSRERWAELAGALHERVRLRDAGELSMPRGQIERFAGTHPGAKDAGQRRAIQYSDAGGVVRGVALYSVKENHDDFTKAVGFVAMVLASANVVGGWFVTDRMLEMFKRRPEPRSEQAEEKERE